MESTPARGVSFSRVGRNHQISDLIEYNIGGLRPGLSLPDNLLQDYYDGDDGDGGEAEVVDGKQENVSESSDCEGLREGLVLPDNILEDYFALETDDAEEEKLVKENGERNSTGLTLNEISSEPSTEFDFENSTERIVRTDGGKSTTEGKAFTDNPSTTLQPSHNENWKDGEKENGIEENIGESGKDEKTAEKEEEQMRKVVEDGEIEDAGDLLELQQHMQGMHCKRCSLSILFYTEKHLRREFDSWRRFPRSSPHRLTSPCRRSHSEEDKQMVKIPEQFAIKPTRLKKKMKLYQRSKFSGAWLLCGLLAHLNLTGI